MWQAQKRDEEMTKKTYKELEKADQKSDKRMERYQKKVREYMGCKQRLEGETIKENLKRSKTMSKADEAKAKERVKTSTGLSLMPRYVDKRVARVVSGKCPQCGEQEPLLMDIVKGKKGCKHYEKRMKERCEEEEEYEQRIADLERELGWLSDELEFRTGIQRYVWRKKAKEHTQ